MKKMIALICLLIAIASAAAAVIISRNTSGYLNACTAQHDSKAEGKAAVASVRGYFNLDGPSEISDKNGNPYYMFPVYAYGKSPDERGLITVIYDRNDEELSDRIRILCKTMTASCRKLTSLEEFYALGGIDLYGTLVNKSNFIYDLKACEKNLRAAAKFMYYKPGCSIYMKLEEIENYHLPELVFFLEKNKPEENRSVLPLIFSIAAILSFIAFSVLLIMKAREKK